MRRNLLGENFEELDLKSIQGPTRVCNVGENTIDDHQPQNTIVLTAINGSFKTKVPYTVHDVAGSKNPDHYNRYVDQLNLAPIHLTYSVWLHLHYLHSGSQLN
jgi:hypothetical protein